MEEEGSPGGLVGNNLPASAGDNWFDPWSAKISRAMEQLNQCATTIELVI